MVHSTVGCARAARPAPPPCSRPSRGVSVAEEIGRRRESSAARDAGGLNGCAFGGLHSEEKPATGRAGRSPPGHRGGTELELRRDARASSAAHRSPRRADHNDSFTRCGNSVLQDPKHAFRGVFKKGVTNEVVAYWCSLSSHQWLDSILQYTHEYKSHTRASVRPQEDLAA